MDKYLQEIERAVQNAGIDGALTKEAVARFYTVLKENEELTTKNASQEKQLSSVRDDLSRVAVRANAAEKCLEEWQGREQDLLTRESQTEVLQMTVKYEQKRVEDHKHMVGLIFRNTTLKKQVMTPTNSSFDQYNNRYDNYPAKDDVTEEAV